MRPVPKLPKFSSDEVLELVRGAPCVRHPSSPGEPHHLPSPFGGSRRALDIVVPLCRSCHRFFHDNPEVEREQLPRLYSVALGFWMAAYGLDWDVVWRAVLEAAEGS